MNKPDKQKILLVEDSDDDVFFFRMALRKCGHACELFVAGDGKEALRLLTEQRFDVVFLDLKVPLLNGFEVLKWLRGQEYAIDLPIYVLSGSAQAVDKGKALDLGATSYFEKPLPVELLRGLIPKPAFA
jgi:CheY-like chemotaxis protein